MRAKVRLPLWQILDPPLLTNVSFRRRVIPGNQLRWYWQIEQKFAAIIGYILKVHSETYTCTLVVASIRIVTGSVASCTAAVFDAIKPNRQKRIPAAAWWQRRRHAIHYSVSVAFWCRQVRTVLSNDKRQVGLCHRRTTTDMLTMKKYLFIFYNITMAGSLQLILSVSCAYTITRLLLVAY